MTRRLITAVIVAAVIYRLSREVLRPEPPTDDAWRKSADRLSWN